MRHNHARLLVCGVALCLALSFSLRRPDTASADISSGPSAQGASCMSILMQAAAQAGIPGEVVSSSDYGGFQCSVSFDHKDADLTFLERSQLFLGYVGDFAEEPCGTAAGASCTETTFHGYPAAYFDFGDVDGGNTLRWNMWRGSAHYSMGAHVSHSGLDPQAYAEALWSVAEDELPTEAPPSGDAQSVPPPEHPGVPSGLTNEVPEGVPLAVAFGNLAVPVVGAAAGALLALGLSGMSSGSSAATAVSAGPKMGEANADGLVWSERPWDEAGPGYVTREEYERTRSLRAQGYEWTKDGWQTKAETQQSQQWQANDKAALQQADADWRAEQKEQGMRRDAEQSEERRRLVESYLPPDAPAASAAPAAAPESPWGFDPSAEAGGAGDFGTGTADPNVGASVTVYKNAYYDMPDKKGDITLFGWDIGNYKGDVKVGAVQAGGGGNINPEKPGSHQAGVGGSASALQVSGEAVFGNQYLGLTIDTTVETLKGEAQLGYKDGAVGGSVGASAASSDVGVGVNLGAMNISGRVGLNAGMEFGFKVGAQGEVKLGPFKFGYSLGLAKTGT